MSWPTGARDSARLGFRRTGTAKCQVLDVSQRNPSGCRTSLTGITESPERSALPDAAREVGTDAGGLGLRSDEDPPRRRSRRRSRSSSRVPSRPRSDPPSDAGSPGDRQVGAILEAEAQKGVRWTVPGAEGLDAVPHAVHVRQLEDLVVPGRSEVLRRALLEVADVVDRYLVAYRSYEST
jgi:hypothetical protein